MVEGLTFSPISTAAVPRFFDVQFMGETCGQGWQNSWLVLGKIPIICASKYSKYSTTSRLFTVTLFGPISDLFRA